GGAGSRVGRGADTGVAHFRPDIGRADHHRAFRSQEVVAMGLEDRPSPQPDTGRPVVVVRPPANQVREPKPVTGTTPERHVVFDLDQLEVFYGKFRAVRNVTMQILRNEITAFIGPSGCGKTTVLRCFNRMHDVTPGARVAGRLHYHKADLYGEKV